MSVYPSRRPSVLSSSRARLLWGVSLATLAGAVGAGPARAQSIGALMAASHQPLAAVAAATAAATTHATAPASSPGMAAAVARAMRSQTQLNSALNLAQQAQAAARAAALTMTPTVPNGLALGGLNPVAHPVTAANDPTGLSTWQGANQPTAAAGDPNQVIIVQTDPRAVLSWQTFNIGRETTLTFSQKQNGVAQPSWVALNRVVGQINPATGLRDASSAPAPSQILGALKSDGTVLVINQNGILFSATAQVNVHSLVATSLEVGHALELSGTSFSPISIKRRNDEFLQFGLLGYADQATPNAASLGTFSAQAISGMQNDPLLEGAVSVEAGATLTSADTGFLMLLAPRVVNAGLLTSPDGQVSLGSGRTVVLTRSQGDVNSIDPDLRGLQVSSSSFNSTTGDYVRNTSTGVILAARGFVSLGATISGGVLDEGVITSTTSVSRNGYVNLSGGDIELGQGAVIAISPDDSPATIPQDPTSLQDFKPSRIRIGDAGARIDIGADSLIYAPGANIAIGADPGGVILTDQTQPLPTRVFVDAGATIDAAGLTNVLIPASRNAIKIRPVKKNELRDAPDFRTGFLNGATVFVDPRISGVRADGVAYVGSPLIEAASYYQQVGITASELMTKGGNVTLGVAAFQPRPDTTQAPDVVVKAGATIDISGGWRTYEAGVVQTTRLVDAAGQVIDIAQASPQDTFVAVYGGFTVQSRWGNRTYVDPVLSGSHAVGAYTEGLDAGTVTLKGSAIVADGQVFAQAFAGPVQTVNSQAGTSSGTIYGDVRKLQGAPSQLPSGGYLNVQALGLDGSLNETGGGGDIAIVGADAYAPLSNDFAYGQGLSFTADGALVVPARSPSSVLPPDRLDFITLNADAISAIGLSQLTVQTSGRVEVAADAVVDLMAGGAFEALAGRGGIAIDGAVTTHGGAIDLTTAAFDGSPFAPRDLTSPGVFDITVDGLLDVSGRWANDFNAAAGQLVGSSFLNGGQITLAAAARVDVGGTPVDPTDPSAPTQSLDVSGSLLIRPGALLDASGGGYVAQAGALTLTARGGSVSLYDDTTYFQLAQATTEQEGALPGFRVSNFLIQGGPAVVVNPDAINAHVSIADGAIRAHGFAGGGTFTLAASQFAFGPSDAVHGAALPLDFFSKAGFSSYAITTYKTDLLANAFDNGLGGFNAVLATDVATVGAGQTLSLTQSLFSPLVDTGQIEALQGLASGQSVYSVLAPAVPVAAWDRRAVNLTLGGLTELHVAAGGQVLGEAGGVLKVGELFNEGLIRIPGGAITQSEVLPSLFGSSTTLGVRSLSDVFTTRADGTIDEAANNALGLTAFGVVLTNAEVAGNFPIYLLGDLAAGEGVRLAAGSVTDVSGVAIVNPRASPRTPVAGGPFTDGVVIAGGSVTSAAGFVSGGALFHRPYGGSIYQSIGVTGFGVSDTLSARTGARIDLAGAQAVFDRLAMPAATPAGDPISGYAPTLIWSDGGNLILAGGGVVSGADIRAQGGAPLALGGALTVLNPILYQSDPTAPTLDAVSADAFAASGFSTFVAQGHLTSVGDVTFVARRSVFVETPTLGDINAISSSGFRDGVSPTLGSGGRLEIDAPYIALDGAFQSLATPAHGTPGANSLILRAQNIDITGAVLIDASIGAATLDSTGDIRLIGVEPYQLAFNTDPSTAPSLAGQLAANGDLTLRAGQVYPTTGTSFSISSAAAEGLITFARSTGATPATPYSAGGALTVQAAHIDQGGVIRAPLGALTLGVDANPDGSTSIFAPATASLVLESGSITQVSADGLVIPYGSTTDQIEWFFSPTTNAKLLAPPAAVLRLAGGAVTVDPGATVNLKGGGDVYAYEFVSGTGGSRDVLDRFNADAFSSNNGYQYPDRRQVYAIVPGLSSAGVAAYDPLYSADYAPLYGPSDAGKAVYLNAAPGLAAGWYTLLPAKYALLPGGLRVVEDTGAAMPPPVDGVTLPDGTVVTSGQYGVAGIGSREAALHVFDVQSQTVIAKESNIALTYGNVTFAASAAHDGRAVPRLPIDAGRLILSPITSLLLGADIQTAPARGGRGAEVDLAGQAITIVAAGGLTPQAALGITLTTDELDNLHAASLFIGGVRTDNADGSTSLDVTTHTIKVAAGASLTAPEILLATDGRHSDITFADGATIAASGAVSDTATGDYIIDGLAADGSRAQSGQGAFVRVANGPERLLERRNVDPAIKVPGALVVGKSSVSGTSVALEAAGDVRLDPDAQITAVNLALGSRTVSFADDATGLTGLVITPTLSALIGEAKHLTIQSAAAISFLAGDYSFGDLRLDSSGLADSNGGVVTLTAGALEISNTGAAGPSCDAAGAPACGQGAIDIIASQIAFGSGVVHTYGAGHGVSLAAAGGIFADGAATFDVGRAHLVLTTPFLGDRGAGTPGATAPNLVLTSGGDVSVSAGVQPAAFVAPPGTPGADLTINGRTVDIQGATLRATAGALRVNAAAGMTIGGGALVETPGYAKSFGDSADAVTVSAPGGLLALMALSGDIAVSDDARLSVGGGQGRAGELALIAHKGKVYAHDASGAVVPLTQTIEASAPEGGASLNLDTGGPFDLSAFAASGAAMFDGGLAIRSGAGDLSLVAGDRLKSASVQLVADGGAVDDAGMIDVSGVNGGAVTLYGADGVRLRAGSLIDSHADGYANDDSRQAHGGDVTLGVQGAGAIRVDQGATIDVSARRPGDRLVNLNRTNGTYYAYAAGDAGGSLTLRAPVIAAPGGDTLAVSVADAGAVKGADSVVLEGVKTFDLAQIMAAHPDYVGVDVSSGQALLSLAAVAGSINVLTDDAPDTIVRFVRDFNVSSAYGSLSGLASGANFHARPGVELDFAGDIVVLTNWNLGAGVVDLAAAKAAGLMTQNAAGQYVVVPGAEGQIFSRFTTLDYRVGGAVTGEPGVLTFRAGGKLELRGSLSDGFFQFHDQTDPHYLNYALGGGDRVYQGSLSPSCSTDCTVVQPWMRDVFTSDYVSIDFPQRHGLTYDPFNNPDAPYSAAANAPDAQGSLARGWGDALGSAQLFPLVDGGGAQGQPIGSWSYQLVAGADLTGPAGAPSVDPLAIVAGSNHAVVVDGMHVYHYQATAGTVVSADSLGLQAGGVTYGADQWLSAFIAANPGLTATSDTLITYTSVNLSVRAVIDDLASQFFGPNPHGAQLFPQAITARLSVAADFMAYVSAHFDQLAPYYSPPAETVSNHPTYAAAPSLVRTGTGSIELAASGDIDLRNGHEPMLLATSGKLITPPAGAPHQGGVAIYTAGRLADTRAVTATDLVTGGVLSVDLAAHLSSADVFASAPQNGYAYGQGSGYAGTLIANPVYASDGGAVSLDAGRDVLGRRDTVLEARLGGVGFGPDAPSSQASWIGTGAQPWRTGVIGQTVDARINPQLFAEGVGTLGGGDITVRAGRDVSDISLVATSSLLTADVGPCPAAAQAVVALGGGDVTVVAGRDMLGGRLDVASGAAHLTAVDDITAAGRIPGAFGVPAIDNALRVRLSDATVSLDAGGNVALQGIAALGVANAPSQAATNLDAAGFYSLAAAVSIRADGRIDIANQGRDVVTARTLLTQSSASAVYPGSLEAVSFTGGLDIGAGGAPNSASEVILYPDPNGELRLLAAGDLAQTTIAMEDGDPSLLPGAFTNFTGDTSAGVLSGRTFLFPAVLPNTPDVIRRTLHNPVLTRAGDGVPNRIVAGGDILDLILSTPKQTRIAAGRDIVNAVFLGQNLQAADITRITAGRDITATTALEQPLIAFPNVFGAPLSTVQGNTFVLGGPGALFVEAGRDAGPFLNSATTNAFTNVRETPTPAGVQVFGGGIITVGAEWNPYLPTKGADIYTEFGVAKGQDFAALASIYLDPAHFASLSDGLFLQKTDSFGNPVADRGKQIYSLSLIDWFQSVAPDIIARYNLANGVTAPRSDAPPLIQFAVRLQKGAAVSFDEALSFLPQVQDRRLPLIPWLELNHPDALTGAFGTLNVSYGQAFDAFGALGGITQRQFLLKDVYFNELAQTSIPTSVSYQKYSRGYQAVNALFPASQGYTENALTGGPGGASTLVETGNLDLRLATIQSAEGGDIVVLGPGGRVLAGSTVRTAQQAARRVYDGGRLYAGGVLNSPLAANISAIPVGYEGVISLRGGAIDGFTDQSLLLNQSRLFTEAGGDIILWSSNADLNAGQGPKTSANFPPVVVRIDENAHSQIDTAGAVSGAGIAAFQTDPAAPAPDVFLIAPRGAVDAGDAGVRSAGNVFIAAFTVANADAIQAQGSISGVQTAASVNVGAQAGADAASAAAAQAAQAVSGARGGQTERPLIIVEVLGYVAEDGGSDDEDQRRRRKKN